jgi:alpha-glucuronidase
MSEVSRGWSQLWLNYRCQECEENRGFLEQYVVVGFDVRSSVVGNALGEYELAVGRMFGLKPREIGVWDDGTLEGDGLVIRRCLERGIGSEGYQIRALGKQLWLEAEDESGLLYGMFHLLREAGMGKALGEMDLLCRPSNQLRMLNHWDNADGTIERGYSGESFFFEGKELVVNERTRDYARLCASVGINGVTINNVNVKEEATYLICDRYLDQVAQLAGLLDGYGIKLFLSLNYAASDELAGLGADPLDPAVIGWWQDKIGEVYRKVPQLGGFLVKADSEGRPGPFTYGRTHSEGANMLGKILLPYRGLLIWRCFVYNCTQDWRDKKTDRARAGYDHFIGSDGEFGENVILQIKNGPMDFQIREPVSPLLGGMRRTNQILEVQAAQEYTGHQIDVCYLIPLYKEVLDFKTYCGSSEDTVADIVGRRTFGNPYGGIAAVSNTGNDANWTGHDLAAANWYGFGRLAFQTNLSAEEIAKEWIALTFSLNPVVQSSILSILLPSREIYENYTCPLGIGWMVTPNSHYGPSVDGYEYSRWGTYHRADCYGLGVDRSDRGTGYAKQYHEPLASLYNEMETCPEEVLLFFHHVPYTYRLKSGTTLIQYIYDSHFQGVEGVLDMIQIWEGLQGLIPKECYQLVRQRFELQLNNAREWCDQVNAYFYRKCAIPDEKGRMIY